MIGRALTALVAAVDGLFLLMWLAFFFSEEGKWLDARGREPITGDIAIIIIGFLLVNFIVAVRAALNPTGEI